MIERDRMMKISLSKYASLCTATMVAVVVSAGILASFGFQQGGPGGTATTVPDWIFPTNVNAGGCVIPNIATGGLAPGTTVNVFGRCDGATMCTPKATCVATNTVSGNIGLSGCAFSKSVTWVLVGNCAEAATICEECPPAINDGGQQTQFLICHVYRTYNSRNASGLCSGACAEYILKFGGICVDNGTP